MVGDGQNLYGAAHLTVDEIKRENVEAYAADCRRVNHSILVGSRAGSGQGSMELCVVAAAKTGLLVFIVGNLLLMLSRRLGMYVVRHLKRDCTPCSNSSAESSCTVPWSISSARRCAS